MTKIIEVAMNGNEFRFDIEKLNLEFETSIHNGVIRLPAKMSQILENKQVYILLVVKDNGLSGGEDEDEESHESKTDSTQ